MSAWLTTPWVLLVGLCVLVLGVWLCRFPGWRRTAPGLFVASIGLAIVLQLAAWALGAR